LTKQLGQTVYIDNKGGGGGIPAMQDVAHAAPDGHTIILGHVGSLAVNPVIFPNEPFDVNKDFVPVTLLAKVPNLFVIHPDVPAKDYQAFVAYAKKHPGQLNYGTAGNASAGHLSMEYLKLVTGMFITHIPYRGTGPAVTDLLGGQIDLMFLPIHVALQQVKAGNLRALAISSDKPSPLLPEVPPLRELNLGRLDVEMWYGVLAPKGTPAALTERLNRELKTILARPDVKTAFETQGMVPASSTPAEFRAVIEKDAQRWAQVIRDQGIVAD